MKVLVLGIGNVMFADEGIGVHFINLIQKNFKFSSDLHTIDFIDGGTLANFLSHVIVDYDHVIIIDCLDADDANIGEIYFFDFEDMPKSINWSGSAHELEMLQTLEMIDLVGDRPPTKILGIIPKRISPMSFILSDTIINSVEIMQKVLLKYLNEIGFKYEKVANLSIQDIANEWKNEQFDT